MALVGDEKHVAIRHNRNLRHGLDDAAAILGLIETTASQAENAWKRMVDRRVTEAEAWDYFRKVFGGKDADNGGKRPLGLKEYAMSNFKAPENKKLRIENTLWAAYNAATWAIDWKRKSKKDRVDDLCLGDGASLKEKAWSQAELMVK